ncbi:MAG: alpha/beta hydrolase [Pseudomonadota bacterium]
MTLVDAPLFTDHGTGPLPGAAYWLTASDGVRIRIGVWGRNADKGTVLLFCGRTEYVEKYAVVACDFAERGFATVVIDWRGQGMADRLIKDRRLGHVDRFEDYQLDVAAVVAACDAIRLPRPLFLLGHSMGGSIGLRAIYEGLPIAAAAFTGPMWGIEMSDTLRATAWALGRVMPKVGLGNTLCPGTTIEHYVLTAPFEDNTLTRHRPSWDVMQAQLNAHPELALGGPTVLWLHLALLDTAALARKAAPDVPCITFLGDNERIVDPTRIHARMAGWKNGTLELLESTEHEVLMDDDATRGRLIDMMVDTFQAAA